MCAASVRWKTPCDAGAFLKMYATPPTVHPHPPPRVSVAHRRTREKTPRVFEIDRNTGARVCVNSLWKITLYRCNTYFSCERLCFGVLYFCVSVSGKLGCLVFFVKTYVCEFYWHFYTWISCARFRCFVYRGFMWVCAVGFDVRGILNGSN